ncbi:4-galactosyl-N-acetylglucosaminide 3-alpha-L-fucosyltransferase 9-like [Dysidea avara]|uniref:4-galactosyl-N-acetylglucosaminide 3-alpha-L-fucosyltransferase 9-like n=1 Tax=Dysidea avara TaxID=196820 RepID=UPI00331CFECC
MATCSSRLSLLLTTVMVLMVIWYVLGQNDENQRLSRSDYYAGRQFLNAEPSRVRRTDRTRTSEGEKNKTSAVADSGILGKSNEKFILGMSNETLCTGRSRRGANPLCTNHSSLIVFSRMSPTVVWQLYLHKEEAEKCVLPNNVICFLTDDYLYYQTADVLLARDCSDLCNRPAYPNQLIVRYNRGPPRMHGKQCRLPSPDFMRVSYTLSSTIPYPYMCYPETRQPLIDALKLGLPSGRHGIAVFVSDPTRWRKKYLKELMKYIHIDSYGDILHNTYMPSSRGKGSDDFISVKLNTIKEKGYKYLIAFENSIFPEYVSEKIWHAYLSQTNPIYHGTSDVYDQVPGANTFIDATKFDGPRQLAEYIKKIEQDDSLYKSFFKFDINQTLRFQKNCPEESLGCAMCKHLYQIKQEQCNFI